MNLTQTLFGFSCFLCLLSCSTPPKDINWNFSKTDITGKHISSTEKLNVDVYLDVTTSMKGFASSTPTNFSKVLDDIEATCQTVWKNTDIQYFKYGRTVAAVKRDEFMSGRTSPVIYSDPTLSSETNFNEALRNTNSKRVSILITDLFYKNGDVNPIADAIKTNSFQNGVELGIIALRSNFNGSVGDVSPPVPVSGERPMYVLIFGDKQNINLLLNTLKNKPYIQRDQILLFTSKPTESYDAEVTKDKTCKTINKQTVNEKWRNFGTAFSFTMREGASEARFKLEATLTENPYSLSFTDRNLKAIAFKKTSSDAKDSIAADDQVIVQNIKVVGSKITADINITNTENAGTKTSYIIYLIQDNTVVPVLPKWVDDMNTEVFRKGYNTDKTLNLKTLISRIATNHMTSMQPKFAKVYIQLYKK